MKKEKCRAYLSGAIDRSPDFGRAWRTEFTKALELINIKAVNTHDFEEKINLPDLNGLKCLEDLSKFKETFRTDIIFPDLFYMDSSNIVIVRWDGEFIVGTAHECGKAFMQHQPVFLVTPKQYNEVPSWLLACCEKEFHTLDELIEYLKIFGFGDEK
jgi:hypothetical protein